MKAPKLLKNESSASFKARVAAWEKRTGKKYPKSGWGTREERALSNRVLLGTFGESIDYSKDYNLDDEAKELSLDPSNNKRWRESEEGVKFSREQLAIQQNVEDAAKEEAYAKAVKGNKNLEESIGKNVSLLTKQVKEGIPPDGKDEVKSNVDIGLKPSHYTGKASESKASESKASGNNSNFKSDIFTINPETGKAVGVLTRSQRRSFEKKYGDKLDKLKIRTYRNKGNTYQRYG